MTFHIREGHRHWLRTWDTHRTTILSLSLLPESHFLTRCTYLFPESPLPPQGLIFKSLNQLRSRMDTLVQKPLIASTQMARFVFTLSLLCLLKACSLPEETFYIHITQGKRQFFVASIFFFLKFYKKLPLVLWKIT